MRTLVGSQAVYGLSVEMDTALFVLQCAADAVDQRALSGAVWTDEADALALLYFELDTIKRNEASEALADIADVKKRGHLLLRARRSCNSPTRPFGAIMTNATSSSPTISRFTAEEIVTVAICCSEPRRMAPTTGPIQLVVPPIIGIAMELTPYSSPKADAGCKYPM